MGLKSFVLVLFSTYSIFPRPAFKLREREHCHIASMYKFPGMAAILSLSRFSCTSSVSLFPFHYLKTKYVPSLCCLSQLFNRLSNCDKSEICPAAQTSQVTASFTGACPLNPPAAGSALPPNRKHHRHINTQLTIPHPHLQNQTTICTSTPTTSIISPMLARNACL